MTNNNKGVKVEVFNTEEIFFTIDEVEHLIELAKIGNEGIAELDEELKVLESKLENMENYEKNPSEELRKLVRIHGGGSSYESVCRFNIKRLKERIEKTEERKILLNKIISAINEAKNGKTD